MAEGSIQVVNKRGDRWKVQIDGGKYKGRLVWILHSGPSTWVFRKTDLKLVYVDDVQTGEFSQMITKEELAYAMNEKRFYADTYKVLLNGLKRYVKSTKDSGKAPKRPATKRRA